MASYNELNALIDAYINRNGVQAITGQILNGVLKAMVEQLGRGYTIMGAAIPTTDPGTPDGPECYFASETGTYTDFDGLQVAPGELALLCYTPSDGWTKATIYEGFQEVGATIDGNVGTPSVGVSYAGGVLSFDFHDMKGNPGQNGQDGAAAGFGTIGADITGGVGTPGVTVESSGPATAKNLQFHFTNLKGETGVTSVVATVDNTTGTPTCTVSLEGQQLTLAFSGLKGAQGDTGSSVDYPFTIVNNLTTDDATQALSAAQGVVLDGKVTQLEAEVGDITPLAMGADGGVIYEAIASDFTIGTTGVTRDCTIGNMTRKVLRISISAGDTLFARLLAGTGSQYVVMAIITEPNTPVRIVNMDNNASPAWYRYTARGSCIIQLQSQTSFTEPCAFVLRSPKKDNDTLSVRSFFELAGDTVHCYRNGDFVWGTMIDSDNHVASGSAYTKTSPIAVTKGQIVAIYARSSGTKMPVIVYTNQATEDSNSIYWHDPAYIVRATTYSWYYHIVREDGYIILQSSRVNYNLETIAFIFNGGRLGQMELLIGSQSIFSHNPKKEFTNIVNQLSRPSVNGSSLQTAPVVLGWISDVHGHEASIRRFLEFTGEFTFDGLLNTGDTATSNYSDGIAYWSRAGAKKVMNVVGNHDTSEGNVIATATAKQVYDMIIAPFVSEWGVTQPTDAAANGYNYYYKDYSAKKLRLVILDGIYWDSTELSWLTTTLTGAKTAGYSVVIATHYRPANVNGIECSFNSLDGNSSRGVLANADAISAVADFITAGGDFVCWLTGHVHGDLLGTVEGHNNQLVITVENGGLDDTWNDSARVAGTKSQDAFNIIGFDLAAGLIKVARVGDDYDKALRHKVTMCYDYRNKRLIYCS